MRRLATVAIIENLEPIPNADKILKATVRGWECVVSKSDMFNVGDKVIFIEVDSVLPPRPEFAFMKDRKYRVRTIKLRKQISQGLVLPMSYLKGHFEVGDDVTKLLGITKYDPQADAEKKLLKESAGGRPWVRWFMRFRWFRKIWGLFKVQNLAFPTNICSKIDEERVQNLPKKFIEWFNAKIPFTVTEKLDGCSATYFMDGKTFGVCSRNIWLRKEDGSPYWEIAKRFDLKGCLCKLQKEFGAERAVIQGEIIGKAIQGNKYHISGYDYFVYNIIVDGVRLPQQLQSYWCKELGLNTVPIIVTDYQLPPTIHEAVEYAKGKSRLLDIEREGLVVRNYDEDISFKIINPEFLLKNNE